MTATRASLKGIGNIFLIALSLLIAACGGGGGGGPDATPAPSSGGEWRGLITFKGTLREGLYDYQEGKAPVTFKYSSADSTSTHKTYNIVEGAVTGMHEVGTINTLTGGVSYVASPATSGSINS